MKMILVSAVALSVLGTTLYQVKTGIDERQDRLKVLETEIKITKRDISVLEAEWAYLSRPERVTELSGRLLQMKPIGQDRILPLDAIPMRLMPSFDNKETVKFEGGEAIATPNPLLQNAGLSAIIVDPATVPSSQPIQKPTRPYGASVTRTGD